jgi:hypothetical protein
VHCCLTAKYRPERMCMCHPMYLLFECRLQPQAVSDNMLRPQQSTRLLGHFQGACMLQFEAHLTNLPCQAYL